MQTSNRSVLVVQEENFFVAKDIETNVASQGEDIESALCNLREALELYYEGKEFEKESAFHAFLTTMEISL